MAGVRSPWTPPGSVPGLVCVYKMAIRIKVEPDAEMQKFTHSTVAKTCGIKRLWALPHKLLVVGGQLLDHRMESPSMANMWLSALSPAMSV